jgi:hypothetical protein
MPPRRAIIERRRDTARRHAPPMPREAPMPFAMPLSCSIIIIICHREMVIIIIITTLRRSTALVCAVPAGCARLLFNQRCRYARQQIYQRPARRGTLEVVGRRRHRCRRGEPSEHDVVYSQVGNPGNQCLAAPNGARQGQRRLHFTAAQNDGPHTAPPRPKGSL